MKVNQSSLLKQTTVSLDILRLKISIRGLVQGVGFRPFIYQLAIKYNLKGWVCNTSADVKIEVEGERTSLEKRGPAFKGS